MLSISLIVPPMVDIQERKEDRKMYDKVASMFLTNVIIVFMINALSGNVDGDCIEAANLLEKNIQGDKTVFILSDDTIRSQYYINYYADDIRPQLCYTDILNANMTDNNIVESIKNTIFKEDYLYIKGINDNFNAAFSYINNGNDYYAGQLYEISDVNGEIKITLVNG